MYPEYNERSNMWLNAVNAQMHRADAVSAEAATAYADSILAAYDKAFPQQTPDVDKCSAPITLS